MRHLSTSARSALLGTVGLSVMAVLTGCEAPQEEAANRYLIIEQLPSGKYVVIEEMPTDGPSRAIIRERDANGNIQERFMNEAEMKALAEQEYRKVQNGTSEVTQEPSGGAGMGLAGTILAVAAGSLMGNMIGNALMGNKNFASRSNSVNRSAYHRSKSGGGSSSKAKSSSSKKSFFGSSSRSSSSRSYGG